MDAHNRPIDCIFCSTGIDKYPTVTVKKGLSNIRDISSQRNDGILHLLDGLDSVVVHAQCRKKYTAHHDHNSVDLDSKKQVFLRNSIQCVELKDCCLYCGNTIDHNKIKKHPERNSRICQVATLAKIDTIRSICLKRNDEWGRDVLSRIGVEIDLVAAGGQYHKNCDAAFAKHGSSLHVSDAPGRPFEEKKDSSFLKLCNFIDNSNECQYQLSDLANKMSEFNPNESRYTEKHLKYRLLKHYGDSIVVTPSYRNFGTIVSFRPVASRLITDNWYKARQKNHTEEKKRILNAAAAIVQEEIFSKINEFNTYPSSNEMESGGSEQIGDMLLYFLRSVMKRRTGSAPEKKVLTVAHAIQSSVRPRSFVSAIHVGLAILLHRRLRSKYLIDLLHNLGVCASYNEILKYESSVTLNTPTHISENAFVQFVFDNADHNTRTVDGNGTFHVMGGVQCVTPTSAVDTTQLVHRPKSLPPSKQTGSFGFIPVLVYEKVKKVGLGSIIMDDVLSLNLKPESAHIAHNLDMLWTAGPFCKVDKSSGWSGFMEVAAGKQHTFDTSAVLPLPFVNLDPSNLTTIYTCLSFAAEECKKRNKKCIVTFDQPLFIKAVDIVSAADSSELVSSIIVRLGGFHLLMSFMGSVGKIMSGSGLEELWEQVFAKNSISHMVSGHAYARAIRAHSLSQIALATLLFEKLLENESINQKDIDVLKTVYDRQMCDTDAFETTALLTSIEPTISKLDDYILTLSNSSRTAKLWLQYFHQVEIIHNFVRAERTGDWRLHLYTVQCMLSYLHAAGHVHYAKAAHLYLQNMLKLESTLSLAEFERFVEQGYFTIRRSDKFWCGVWTDMTIEQVLMRSLKCTGGLTRGHGLTDSVIACWISAMPSTMQVTEAVEKFAGITNESSEQHVQLTRAWQNRDTCDTEKFLNWLKQHSPFNRPDDLLVSLSSGVIASDKVNCDSAVEIGMAAVNSMAGKTLKDVTVSRKNQVSTLAAMGKTVVVGGEPVIINPNQLFHRIACIVRSDEELQDCLRYELAPRPQSLFDNISMRSGTKSKLIQIIERNCEKCPTLPDNPQFVLDGGDLLHRVPWPRPATYGEVCDRITRYVQKNYGENVIIVFDGYDISSTKDAAHIRRASGKPVTPEVAVGLSAKVIAAQHQFLANISNKSRFVKLLGSYLQQKHCIVLNAASDADTLIVNTAIKKASEGYNAIVVGEDTDLLVLIAAMAHEEVHLLIPGSSLKERKVFSSKNVQESLGNMKHHIMFILAMMGCDTTSAPYKKGHITGYRKLEADPHLQSIVVKFNDSSASQDDIVAAGETFFVKLYGGKAEDGLDKTRFKKYVQLVGKKTT